MMSNPNYGIGKAEGNIYAGQNPPPYSEKLLNEVPGQREMSAQPTAPMIYETHSSMLPQYSPYYGPPVQGYSQVQVLQPPLQPPQTMLVNVVYPVKEQDHMCYSIFTMLCCCLPIGIAALVYSIKTREANDSGDYANAQRFSRTARTLGHTALGLGLGSIILLIIIVIVVSITAASTSTYHTYSYRTPQ